MLPTFRKWPLVDLLSWQEWAVFWANTAFVALWLLGILSDGLFALGTWTCFTLSLSLRLFRRNESFRESPLLKLEKELKLFSSDPPSLYRSEELVEADTYVGSASTSSFKC